MFNFCAERLKHHNQDDEVDEAEAHLLSEAVLYEHHYQRKLRLLYLEVIPPLISVSTLAVVTAIALTQAIQTLLASDADQSEEDQPDLFLMLLFSGINFVLDGINVLCFARADQAKGLTGGFSQAYQLHSCTCDYPTTIADPSTMPNSTPNQRDHQPDCPVATTGNSKKNNNNNINISNEATHLLSSSETAATVQDDESQDSESSGLNLNMCSAWTQ